MEHVDHSRMVQLEKEGRVLIGVEPSIARRFFMEADPKVLDSLLGERLGFERISINTIFLLGWLLVLASMALAPVAFGWWATLVIPVSFIIWSLYMGQASLGQQNLWPTLSSLVLAFVALLLSSHGFQYWLLAIAAAFFFVRLTYFASSRFVRRLVLRNPRAVNLIDGKDIKIVYCEPDDQLALNPEV